MVMRRCRVVVIRDGRQWRDRRVVVIAIVLVVGVQRIEDVVRVADAFPVRVDRLQASSVRRATLV